MPIIVTPRPPLNLFEVVRVDIENAGGSTWSTIYQTPLYRIPANGPNPQRDVEAAAIITGLLVSNTSSVISAVSVRILNAEGDPYTLLTQIQIPIGDYIILPMDRQVLKTDETLQLQCATATTASVSFSFILNQRESFEVIT